MIPRKALPHPIGCDNCGELCGGELLEITHRAQGKTTIEARFCSPECLYQYLGVTPTLEVERKVRKEYNRMYQLVCPACKRRYRQKEVVD